MYFDIEAHSHCFKTNENEAFFWHGRTNNVGGASNAEIIASENNGKTLNMCMQEHQAELEQAGVTFEPWPDGKGTDIYYSFNENENSQFWDACSKSFAEQASGDVHVIDGSDPRGNIPEQEFPNTYNRIEHPALEQNPNVNSIIHVNPETQQVTGVENLNHNSPQIQSTNHISLTGIDPTHTSGTSPPVHNESDTAYRGISQAQVPGNEVVSDEALKNLQQSNKPTYLSAENEIPTLEQLKSNNQTTSQTGTLGNEVMTDEQLQNMKNSFANGTAKTDGNAIGQGTEHAMNGVSASSFMGGGIT